MKLNWESHSSSTGGRGDRKMLTILGQFIKGVLSTFFAKNFPYVLKIVAKKEESKCGKLHFLAAVQGEVVAAMAHHLPLLSILAVAS